MTREHILIVVQLPDGLLQVSHAAVDELCAFATRSARKILSFDHGNFEPSSGSVEGDSRTGRAPSDDKEIVGFSIFMFLQLLGGRSLFAASQASQDAFCGPSDSIDCRLYARTLLEICDLFVARLDKGKAWRREPAIIGVSRRRYRGRICTRYVQGAIDVVKYPSSGESSCRGVKERAEEAAR